MNKNKNKYSKRLEKREKKSEFELYINCLIVNIINETFNL